LAASSLPKTRHLEFPTNLSSVAASIWYQSLVTVPASNLGFSLVVIVSNDAEEVFDLPDVESSILGAKAVVPDRWFY